MLNIREQVGMWALLASSKWLAARATVQDLIELSRESASPIGSPDLASIHRAETTCRRMTRWVPGATCLHQAVATRVWLAAKGVESTVVIGFRKRDEFEGHAWLELKDGTCLFSSEQDAFSTVWTA